MTVPGYYNNVYYVQADIIFTHNLTLLSHWTEYIGIKMFLISGHSPRLGVGTQGKQPCLRKKI
jgi:hypothetical protein